MFLHEYPEEKMHFIWVSMYLATKYYTEDTIFYIVY